MYLSKPSALELATKLIATYHFDEADYMFLTYKGVLIKGTDYQGNDFYSLNTKAKREQLVELTELLQDAKAYRTEFVRTRHLW